MNSLTVDVDLSPQDILDLVKAQDDPAVTRRMAAAFLIVSSDAHQDVHGHRCLPDFFDLLGYTTDIPARNRTRSVAAALVHLWFTAQESDNVSSFMQCATVFDRLTHEQRHATLALMAVYMRRQIAELPPRVRKILVDTFTCAPLPDNAFAHIHAAVYAGACGAGDFRQEQASLAMIADGGMSNQCDVLWILARTIAARFMPGETVPAPSGAYTDCCPHGIDAANVLAQWVTSISSGTPRMREYTAAQYEQYHHRMPEVSAHLFSIASHWLGSRT